MERFPEYKYSVYQNYPGSEIFRYLRFYEEYPQAEYLIKSGLTANNLFKKLLGDGKTAYNLRHTFSTLCQQYVRQEIVEIWIGDSPVRLIGKHYTHFSDKFMREEMNKVIFPTVN